MSIEQEITSLIEDHLDTVYDIQDKSSLECIIRREVENTTTSDEGDVLDMVTTEVSSQVRDLSDEYELLTHDQYAAIQSRLNVLELSDTTVKEKVHAEDRNQIDWIMPPNDMIAGYSDFQQLESYVSACGADNATMVLAMVLATVRNLIEVKLVEKGANQDEQ